MATSNIKKQESTGMYTAGMVCGIVGIVLSFIPGVSWIGLILGVLALIFGITGLVKKEGGGKAITATVLGAISSIIGIVMIILVATVFNTAMNIIGDGMTESISDALANYESDIVGKYVDVDVQGYQEVSGDIYDGAVVVVVKNISDQTRSFSIGVAALDENGNRLDTSSFYAENLAPGQSQTFNIFTLSKLKAEDLKNATYEVYQSSTY